MEKVASLALSLGLFIYMQSAASFRLSSSMRPVINSHSLSGLRSSSLQMVSTPHGGKV